MKKLIYLIILALFLSCSNDDDDGCTCDVEITVVEEDSVGEYTFTNVPSDCKGNINEERLREEGNLPDNHWIGGTKNCTN